MGFWQFLNDNLWTIVFIFVFFGGSVVTSVYKFWDRLLTHRLDVEKEITKQMQHGVLPKKTKKNSGPSPKEIGDTELYEEGYKPMIME